MRISQLRGGLYKAARLLGDYQAVRTDLRRGTWATPARSRIVRRVGRRIAGRWVGLNIFRRIFG